MRDDWRFGRLDDRVDRLEKHLAEHKDVHGSLGGCLMTIALFVLANVVLRVLFILAHQLTPPHTDDILFLLFAPFVQVTGGG